MHRLSLMRGFFTAALLALVMLGSASCATSSFEVRDTPEIEMLRLRITKVRNAIFETRETISMSRGAPYLPELYLRLAELLSEEARYHYQLAFERERRSTRDLYVPEVRLLKEESIEIYTMVLRRFPTNSLAPRMLFNLSHEHRELGNFDPMRVALQRLVEEHPTSPLRFQALLVLGDNEFDKNELKEAELYYKQITRGDLNASSGLAHYKLGWVWVNFGECKKALTDFELAISKTQAWLDHTEEIKRTRQGVAQLGEQTLGADQDMDVRRSALVDLAYCYSQERSHERAVAFFRERAYDRATYVIALGRLANRYRMMEQYKGLLAISRELLAFGPAEEDRLDDARTLYTAMTQLREFDQIGTDIELIASAFTRYHTQIAVANDVRGRLRDEFEVYVRDVMTRAQTRLQETPAGDKQVALALQLAHAYGVYADTFPQADQLAPMLLNMAEVLVIAGEELDAGLRALQAADLLEEGDERKNALYDAVVNFQASLSKEIGRRQYDRVAARAALRRAGHALVSFDLDKDRRRRVRFAMAQSYYDEGRYIEAIDKLSAVAYEYPASEESEAAIRMVLDSYNMRSDYDGLIYASRRFLDGRSPANPNLKGEIQQILAAAEQRKLDTLSLQAAGEDGGELSPLEDFAKIHKGTPLGERALLNAFVAARATGDTSRMYALADEIAGTYPKSEQLSGIYSTLAQTAVSRFEYDRAIGFLQRAATYNPERRAQLLTVAGSLLEELGDVAQAEKLYREAIGAGRVGGARANAISQLSFLLERRSTPAQLIQQLTPHLGDGNPELTVRLGLAQLATGQTDSGGDLLQRVLRDGEGASGEAQARAHYGLAEVMLATLNTFPSLEDIDLLQDYIMLVEVTQQSYLNAARQGSAHYTTVSLSRLAFALRQGANQLRSVKLGGLDGGQRQQVENALKQRVESLEATASEALDACAARLWTNLTYDPVVRKCIDGMAWEFTLAQFIAIQPRQKVSDPAGLDELRERLSRNADDVDGLRDLGLKFLEAGDAHVARLVFARAVQAGGGPVEQNLLGEASFRVGDTTGAFEAFARAAEGGLEAGRQNLAKLLRNEGLAKYADEVFKRYPEGRAGGRQI
ncbi:MAG: tetratricopeptide repeat protein [Bradymonadaceae bacterium]|nr:tetratricopeptide repeat protein [Lujinxingiaceae bacterium]